MNPRRTPMQPEVRKLLKQLRRRIRRYVLLEGFASLIVLLGAVFWFSFLLDVVWFRASRLELPRGLRIGLDVLAVSLIGAALVAWIGLRLFRSFRTKALALVLERRFPELDDRLITVVEMSQHQDELPTPLAQAMFDRTTADVVRLTRDLDLDRVFEKRPLHRTLILAGVVVFSIGGLALAASDEFRRWKAGYLDLAEQYWDRSTALSLQVIAEPGRRLRPFDEQQVYKHPRGGDLTLLARAVKGDPRAVQVQYRFASGGRRGPLDMQPVSPAELTNSDSRPEFRYSVGGLLDDIDVWVIGDDYTNRRAFRVRIVDPPRVDQITLRCAYPEYTGMNGNPALRERVVLGSQISLPLGTQFEMLAAANKPLTGIRVQTDRFELSIRTTGINGGRATEGILNVRDEAGEIRLRLPVPADLVAQALSPGGNVLRLPLLVDRTAAAAWEQPESVPLPLPVTPDSLMRIWLEDADGIINADPARLTVNGVVDMPPAIEAERKGIGTMITRRASIPVSGRISDDYGIAAARFEYRLGTGNEFSDWKPREFRNPPRETTGQLPREWALNAMVADRDLAGDTRTPRTERFDILPLDLQVGQSLRLSVLAEDADDLHGPNSTRAEVQTFRIVSNEELLSLLYGRELNLRLRFEQIITEVRETRRSLVAEQERLGELGRLRQSAATADDPHTARAEVENIQLSISVAAERALHAIRKNRNETAALEEEFRDILSELINNRIPQGSERVQNGIVDPLHRIVEEHFLDVDRSVGRFKTLHERGEADAAALDPSVTQLDAILARMQDVLKEMEELMKFHKALEELQAIIEAQDGITDEIRRRQKERLRNLGLEF